MNKLKKPGPSIEQYWTLLVTGIQLVFVPLIMTFWDLLLSQFSIQLTVSSLSPHFLTLPMRILWEISVENLPEVKIGNTHCISLIHPSSFIIIGDQVGQTWLTFRESMQTMPDHFVIHMARDGLQDFLRSLSQGYAYDFCQSWTLNSWSEIAESQGDNKAP